LRTSIELFAERGFHGTSMRQLAQRADLRQSAFYYYFRSKYDVLLAIMDDGTKMLEEEAAEVPDDLATEEHLTRLMEGHVRVHLLEPELMRVCDREIRTLRPADRTRITDRLDVYESLFRGTLRAGRDEGLFPSDSDILVMTKSMLVMGSGVVEWWQSKGKLSVDDVATMISGYALDIARAGSPVVNKV
jgi:AcrR family transcriptional regulator